MNAPSNLRFLDAPGEVAAMMRAHDWRTSPLGPPEHWPQSLRSVVSLMLRSQFPMFVAWGPSLGFLYNDPYSEILGTKHPDALGRPFEEIWFEIWDDVGPLARRALAGEAVYFENLPLTMLRKGYEEHTWFTFSYSPVIDEQGEVAGMYCACTETTTGVTAERMRLAQMQRLTSLFAQAPGFVAVTRGREHVYEIANPAYLALVGRQNIVGLSVRAALPELDQKFIDQLTQVFETGVPYIGRRVPVGLRREGQDEIEDRIVDFVFQPIADDDGRIDGIFIQGTDISDRVRAEADLRDSEARFRTITNAMPQMVWSALPDGYNDYYNQQWYEFTGLTAGTTEGERWAEVLHPDDLPGAWARWRHSLDTGEEYDIQFRLRHHAGDYRWVLVRAVPVRGDDGAIVRWLGTATDIHEQRVAQDALERSERALREADQRKDEFLAMLAHELRNPLAPISTASQLLLLTSDPTRVRIAGEVIGRQVRHMTELVDDLLDVSRVTRGLVHLDLETVDLKSVVASAIEQVRTLIEARGHALRTRLPPGPLWVRGDRTRLVQILANLLNNAAKYTQEGGEIDLDAEAADGNACVHVRDNGQGIDPVLLPRIFDLFTQADRSPDRTQGGLGIGLALVRSLVALHGGAITADSAGRHHGAVFSVSLPQVQGPVSEDVRTEVTAPREDAVLDIVVVDDNVDAAKTLQSLLQALGHRARVFHRAGDAFDAIVAAPPHVAFLDIGLPDITGHQLARRIRAQLRERTGLLVALSGYGQPHDQAASRDAGMDVHLVKPIDQATLLDVLARAGQGKR
ncbi:hypothetical protein LYSHEL_22160 [Lysobacter helvus]|uniref:histidine kinase n=2 Tax=Lysobacteraceae TaxID=32033 RepID=A0ABM7Q783_9GAMM|nr:MULTISPECIES: PAS domain-containing protein [Lysobacter]BCT93193.1 hypothetical protein LYSCAS_22170 [Lysobacter caseinilyticus]BCT96345.1 hypothetical protein LYSHEL_22160 [Lysobacter helvus]